MLTSLLETLYFSAIRLATALAPRNSEFQLWEEDACFFSSFSFLALKSVEAATQPVSMLVYAGLYKLSKHLMKQHQMGDTATCTIAQSHK